ncbi:GntR family transcriptional regulator [Oricola sp.]|uniref:GntR family transcriptional regulator n=1 Tax=Oricola sp. TaxID=1979950 RepID=UPI0025DD7DEA|nr:GntR family transcriptional regulator [Oricola sp.]MCI5074539.1 GntR family transcriptional regulator [Oricola sp.]
MRPQTQSAVANIRAWVEETIASSEPGDRLPTMRQIMRRFQTAQRTVEEALRPYMDSGALRSRPGAGIVVADPDERAPAQADYEGDLLVLYRSSDSRLARNLLQEMESRLKSRGLSILQIGFSTEEQALSVLQRIGRFKTCLLQVNFEVLSIAFLAALHRHVDSIVVDGVSATGIDVDSVGTNWREAVSVAFRILREKGHERIAFLTSAHRARQIAMARREFELLSAALPDPSRSWLVEVDRLPGSYQISDISSALEGLKGKGGALPFTALIVWGVVEGFILERALSEIGQEAGKDVSVILLASVDFASEHLGRFDVVGNSNAEKLKVFEELVADRIAGTDREPETHYLTIDYQAHGSVTEP